MLGIEELLSQANNEMKLRVVAVDPDPPPTWSVVEVFLWSIGGINIVRLARLEVQR